MIGQRSGGGLFVLLIFLGAFFLLDLLTFYLQALMLFVNVKKKLKKSLSLNELNIGL